MGRMWIGLGLASVLALPGAAQKKEQERVENAGTVVQEILNAPDSIPQGVLDKAECVVVLPSVVKFAIGIGGSYGQDIGNLASGNEVRAAHHHFSERARRDRFGLYASSQTTGTGADLRCANHGIFVIEVNALLAGRDGNRSNAAVEGASG